MSVRGKSINLFLMDSTPTGRIKVTLANWTGVAYKIPRTELDKCKGCDDLSQSGVYFLFGTDDQPVRTWFTLARLAFEKTVKAHSDRLRRQINRISRLDRGRIPYM